MAMKRSTNGAAKTVGTKADVLDEEGFYCLKGELLWKYRAMDAEHETAKSKLQRLSDAVQHELDKNPVLKELLSEKAEAARNVSMALKELDSINREIEQHLGVELKNCGIDEKTGRVHLVLTDGTGGAPLAPVGPKIKTKRSKAATAKG